MNIPINTRIIKFLPIVDVRSQDEWAKTGIIENSITLSFFDNLGNYNEKEFIKKLSNLINVQEQFAIVCHTGARTAYISRVLKEQNLDVINLEGGIKSLAKQGYELKPYKKVE